MFTKLVPTEHLSHYTPFDGHFLLGFGTPWVKILELFPYTETVRLDDSLREAEKCCQENVQWTPSMPGPQSSPHLRSWNSMGDPNMRESPAYPGKWSGLLTLSSQTLGGNFPFLFPLLLGQRKWHCMPATIQVSQFKPGRCSTVLQVGTPWTNCFQLKYSCVCTADPEAYSKMLLLFYWAVISWWLLECRNLVGIFHWTASGTQLVLKMLIK